MQMRIEIIRDEILPDKSQIQLFSYAGRYHVRVVVGGVTQYCGNYADEVAATTEYEIMKQDWN